MSYDFDFYSVQYTSVIYLIFIVEHILCDEIFFPHDKVLFNLINLWLFFFEEYKLLFLLDVLFQETIWNVRLFHRHPILVCYTSLNHQVNWMKRESREKKKGFHGCTAPKDMEHIIRVLLVRQGC